MALSAWFWFALMVGAWLSSVVLILLFLFLMHRRQTLKRQFWGWLAAFGVAWVWSLSMALSFLLPWPWSWYARHLSRFAASLSVWALWLLLGMLVPCLSGR